MAKKINEKALVKAWGKAQVQALFEGLGLEVLDNARDDVDFQGMTKDTLVIRSAVIDGVKTPIDLQVKFITPSDKVGNAYSQGE